VEGQFRTLLSELEEKFGHRVRLDHKIVPWMVRHVGDQLTKLQPHVGDGKTSWERRTGKKYQGEQLTVGETAMFKTGERLDGKAVLRWTRGLFVGRDRKSDEFLFLTERGLGRSRSVQRKTEKERWSWEFTRSEGRRGIPTDWRRRKLRQQRRSRQRQPRPST
jgi:hypothetical protein